MLINAMGVSSEHPDSHKKVLFVVFVSFYFGISIMMTIRQTKSDVRHYVLCSLLFKRVAEPVLVKHVK